MLENVNNYDHNILELGNRLPRRAGKSGNPPLYESVNCAVHKRSNSHNAVRVLYTRRTIDPPKSTSYIMDVKTIPLRGRKV